MIYSWAIEISLSIASTTKRYPARISKVGCVFPMVICPEVRIGQYRDADRGRRIPLYLLWQFRMVNIERNCKNFNRQANVDQATIIMAAMPNAQQCFSFLTNWKNVSSWLSVSRYSVDVLKMAKIANSKIKHGNSHRNIRNRIGQK